QKNVGPWPAYGTPEIRSTSSRPSQRPPGTLAALASETSLPDRSRMGKARPEKNIGATTTVRVATALGRGRKAVGSHDEPSADHTGHQQEIGDHQVVQLELLGHRCFLSAVRNAAGQAAVGLNNAGSVSGSALR